jgi:spore coat polysaccharide biosynthesis predicted glycosyltransferase SpsG
VGSIFLISDKTIFISPLDWGLGHASRCVPLIYDLKKNNKIIIGVTELNAFFFEYYFPDLEKITLPSYQISYSKVLPLWFKLLLQWPKIKSVIKLENKVLEILVTKYKIDVVISDNRYGLYHKNVKSIFVTHQLNLQAPFSFGIANRINRKCIHRFSEVWVPDYQDKNQRLSGQLSDSEDIKIPVTYIGPQSALTIFKDKSIQKRIDYLILLSGPEPQRTILEEQLIEKFSSVSGEIVLVRGANFKSKTAPYHIKVINFAYDNQLKNLIVNAETIICRSGYSTLMDLHLLEKKQIILVPTPGQTEQEYLASYWHVKYGTTIINQQRIKSFNPQ